MLFILNAVNKKRYHSLIEYVFTRCDMFTLRVPTHILGEDNEFKKGILQKLEVIRPFVIKEYVDSEYFYSTGGDYRIYVIKLDKKLSDFLTDSENLYHWEYPRTMPEDLCFISKGECWLESIAHEELCRIFTQNTSEIDFLMSIGFKFIEQDCETPLLEF